MTVAPGVLASTAANTRTEAGRCSAAAVLRATTMSREIYCGKILPRDLQVRRRVGRSLRGAVAEGSAPSHGASEYPRPEPRGPIVEKRRLHLASCDEALFIITTSPLDSPTASARPLTHPAERRLVVPTRPWPTGAPRACRSPRPCVATGCTATST